MTDRTPYCHKIRYGITGAPILTDDEMDGSHAPGVGIAPALIELIYSAPRDGKPASVSASVTGAWTRFGRREDDARDDQVTTDFKSSPDGWPGWLAAEARLHAPADPAAPPVPADNDLRTLIRGVIWDCPALYPDDVADRVWAALQSAYRRLLARLEADRAGHLRATVRATEAGAGEVLVAVGGASAAASRHAAAMAVAELEGPDAAQAYMQRTEGGEQVAVDVDRAAEDRLGEELDEAAAVIAEKTVQNRDQSATLARVHEWVTSNVVVAANEFGNGYREAQRDIRDLIDGRRRMADEAQPAECACDPAPHRQPDGTYSHWAGCPVADAEQLLDERVAAAKEQPVEARQACPCGQPGCEYCDVEDDDAEEAGDVVAYRNSDRPGVLLCREHGDGWMGLTPLTSDCLPDGGLCVECGVDVLIPQQQAGEGR